MDNESTDRQDDPTTFSGPEIAHELGHLDSEAINTRHVTCSELTDLWRSQKDKPLRVVISEYGYPLVDLTSESAEDAMRFLESLDKSLHSVVYHGMHNNEYRRAAGMPDVQPWSVLDPAQSHQSDDRKAIYATKSLKGGLVHAVLETKAIDANPLNGEVYSLRPEPGRDGSDSFIEVSPLLEEALNAKEERFTNGLLYILPEGEFTKNPNSIHEVLATKQVAPLTVIEVGKNLGPGIITPATRWVRID